jgi:HEAT repeat protein
MNALVLALLIQNPTDVGAALDRLAAVKPGDGAAYEAEREKVLAFGKDALAPHAAPDRWTAAGWVRAMAAEACRLRLANPELAAEVDRLEGLDPARYRLFRHGEPTILPALAHRGADAVPLLIERWRWTFDRRAYSDGEAGEKERETLRHAILSLPGRVPDARAGHFLAEILASKDARDSWRSGAAVSLAAAGGTPALPQLTTILDDATQPAAVREACARAIGRIADPAALEAVRARLADEKDPQVRRSYLHGLGILGSAWGWESRGKDVASIAETIRAGCAETLVESIRRYPAESETIGIALSMTKWAASLKSVEALTTNSSVGPEAREAAAKILPALRQALSRVRD